MKSQFHSTWGRTSPTAASTSTVSTTAQDVDNLLTTATKLAPLVKAYTDAPAYEDVEVLKAKIKNQARLRDSMPEPIKTFYANNVRVLQAKLKAARHAKKLEAEDRASVNQWSMLGKSATLTGVAVGAALVVLLLSRARS